MSGTNYSIHLHYNVYEYNAVFANNTVGGVLNEDLTTIDFETSWEELNADGGIYENILLNTFYSSLSLINSN